METELNYKEIEIKNDFINILMNSYISCSIIESITYLKHTKLLPNTFEQIVKLFKIYKIPQIKCNYSHGHGHGHGEFTEISCEYTDDNEYNIIPGWELFMTLASTKTDLYVTHDIRKIQNETYKSICIDKINGLTIEVFRTILDAFKMSPHTIVQLYPEVHVCRAPMSGFRYYPFIEKKSSIINSLSNKNINLVIQEYLIKNR
jgi:hypothetical protein